MKLILFDIDRKLCGAWEEEFKDYKNIEIINCLFEDLDNIDYMVTAGNSYGWMTGGIDLAVRDYFGISFQDYLQKYIILKFNGELPVGELISIKSGKKNIKNIVYAPTMRMPQKIKPITIFYIFYNILDTFMNEEYNDITLACCGLGTNAGCVLPEVAAKTMREAYDYYIRTNAELKKCLLK